MWRALHRKVLLLDPRPALSCRKQLGAPGRKLFQPQKPEPRSLPRQPPPKPHSGGGSAPCAAQGSSGRGRAPWQGLPHEASSGWGALMFAEHTVEACGLCRHHRSRWPGSPSPGSGGRGDGVARRRGTRPGCGRCRPSSPRGQPRPSWAWLAWVGLTSKGVGLRPISRTGVAPSLRNPDQTRQVAECLPRGPPRAYRAQRPAPPALLRAGKRRQRQLGGGGHPAEEAPATAAPTDRTPA